VAAVALAVRAGDGAPPPRVAPSARVASQRVTAAQLALAGRMWLRWRPASPAISTSSTPAPAARAAAA
jgi:hypothetical protein